MVHSYVYMHGTANPQLAEQGLDLRVTDHQHFYRAPLKRSYENVMQLV